MNTLDILFWIWFVIAALFLIFSMVEEYSMLSVFFSINIIGFGLLKLSQEKQKATRVSRKLLEKLKSI